MMGWWKCGLLVINLLSANVIDARFLPNFLDVPSTCTYDNRLHRCSFTFTCWLVGGSLHEGCGEDSDWLFTCCVPSVTSPDNEIDEASSEVLARTPVIWDKSQDVSAMVPPGTCGVPALQLQKRIIGGNQAYFGEFPWQAHIRIDGYQCGGALVSEWFVLTAAHCVHRARLKDIKIYLGEYDTLNTGKFVELYPEEVFKVSKKIIHPSFYFRVTQPDRYDIALLKLSKKVKFRENILPICLPTATDSFEGYDAVIAGWGKTDNAFGRTGTNILHKAVVPILSEEECLEWHQQKNIHVELFPEMLCAGHSDGHVDACLGDSGGPLIVVHKEQWTLAGVTSAGFGCAIDHQPGIYQKISATSKWIRSEITKS